MHHNSLGPGDDIDAWCTRCRMNLNHRIVAVVGRSVKTVQCLTCEGIHKYHLPKKQDVTDDGEYEDLEPKKTPIPKTVDKAAAKNANEWATFLKTMPSDAVPREYSMHEMYSHDDYLNHPIFGLGKVIDIMGRNKIQVVFKEGRKILVCNRQKTA
jgi:hypothetical protein